MSPAAAPGTTRVPPPLGPWATYGRRPGLVRTALRFQAALCSQWCGSKRSHRYTSHRLKRPKDPQAQRMPLKLLKNLHSAIRRAMRSCLGNEGGSMSERSCERRWDCGWGVRRGFLRKSQGACTYFSGGSDSKESACNAGDPGSIPGSGRSPGGGHGNPLLYSCLENSMDRGAWWATVHGWKAVRHD